MSASQRRPRRDVCFCRHDTADNRLAERFLASLRAMDFTRRTSARTDAMPAQRARPADLQASDAPSAIGWTATRRASRSAICRLMRADRPIGTWLLLWPCWWSVALAWMQPGADGPISGCCSCSPSAQRSCAAPAAPITTSPTAITTPRSPARGRGRFPAARSAHGRGGVHGRAVLHRPRGAAPIQPLRHRPRHRLAGHRRALSVHEAHHLLAADRARPRLLLGRADGLGGRFRRLDAPRSCSISPRLPGPSATTPSMPIRTRKTTRWSA